MGLRVMIVVSFGRNCDCREHEETPGAGGAVLLVLALVRSITK